jgi:hypothetical protein
MSTCRNSARRGHGLKDVPVSLGINVDSMKNYRQTLAANSGKAIAFFFVMLKRQIALSNPVIKRKTIEMTNAIEDLISGGITSTVPDPYDVVSYIEGFVKAMHKQNANLNDITVSDIPDDKTNVIAFLKRTTDLDMKLFLNEFSRLRHFCTIISQPELTSLCDAVVKSVEKYNNLTVTFYLIVFKRHDSIVKKMEKIGQTKSPKWTEADLQSNVNTAFENYINPMLESGKFTENPFVYDKETVKFPLTKEEKAFGSLFEQLQTLKESINTNRKEALSKIFPLVEEMGAAKWFSVWRRTK